MRLKIVCRNYRIYRHVEPKGLRTGQKTYFRLTIVYRFIFVSCTFVVCQLYLLEIAVSILYTLLVGY